MELLINLDNFHIRKLLINSEIGKKVQECKIRSAFKKFRTVFFNIWILFAVISVSSMILINGPSILFAILNKLVPIHM